MAPQKGLHRRPPLLRLGPQHSNHHAADLLQLRSGGGVVHQQTGYRETLPLRAGLAVVRLLGADHRPRALRSTRLHHHLHEALFLKRKYVYVKNR